MPTGYCTVDDVRQVMQDPELSGALAEADNQVVVNAIAAVSSTVEKATHRHWYVKGGLEGDDHGLVPTEAKTRDDEHDIPTHGGFVHGSSERRRGRFRANSDALLESSPRYADRRRHFRQRKREIRLAFGDPHDVTRDRGVPAYTRIPLDRKDVEAVNKLMVVNDAGGFDDWTEEYQGGVGNEFRGDDWWLRINNFGVAELYLDVRAMDNDIASFSNAVYVDIDYGKPGLLRDVRQGVAYLTASDLASGNDELVVGIPDNAQLSSLETKAERWGRLGVQKLESDIVNPELLEAYR